jgi:hypothetical protein
MNSMASFISWLVVYALLEFLEGTEDTPLEAPPALRQCRPARLSALAFF